MKAKSSGGRPGGLTPAVVLRIRRVFDARSALPSDAELAAECGLSAAMIRKVGRRLFYRHVSDDQ